MNNIWIGSTAGPVGLKGEIKIITDINHQDKIFKINNNLIINDNPYTIKTLRFFKNHYIISFQGYEDINKINDLLHQDVYVNKDHLSLLTNEFLYTEIIGFTIMDNQEKIGIVKNILLNKKNYFIQDDRLIIPMIDKYLVNVDLKNRIINVQNSKELSI